MKVRTNFPEGEVELNFYLIEASILVADMLLTSERCLIVLPQRRGGQAAARILD